MSNTDYFITNEQIIEVLSLSKTATAIHVSEDAIIQLANEAMLNIWDKDSSVIGKSLEDALPELKGQPFIDMFKRVWNEGLTISGTDTAADLVVDGQLQTFYFDFEYRAIKDNKGKTYCILHTATDVTDRVVGKLALERAREQQEALSREQALNEELAAANEELAATNEELQHSQLSLLELNETLEDRVTTRTLALTYSEEALQNANHELAAINEELATTNEELIETQESLQDMIIELSESEERFRAMAEATNVLIAVADETSNAIYFNNAWIELTGRSINDLLKFGWVDLIHPEDKDRFVNIFLSAFKQQVPFGGEFRVMDKNGDYRWLLAKGPPRFRPDGSFAGYISSCVDITELKLEEQRKDDFISIASHELKTPLTALKASLQLMDRVKETASPQILPKLIVQSNRSMEKITGLVEDLLNSSRTTEGQLHLNKSTFTIAEMLSGCCGHIRMAGKHDLVLQGDKKLQIFADEHRIDQVIVNLVNNAVKYAPDSKEIFLAAEKVGDVARISVKDTGPGITPDKIPHLFNRYYRADYAGSQYSGLGLGLYISAEIIKRHGGKIGVDTELGKGSTFWFTIPL
ncbi:ATP-binding protein [Mucilaginibacter polytrichastri]|uniref:histidine kinase n=1 Tax=Mucilaginibacter polytrichastri TaxID=1302689 RepID=A0A1Q5ZX48_9SPHI|nr:ATP-binding protein [Mucilaginibacter polytrichastri]OKS86327.1 hypothetical protein RG47T_1781 [Mucilaginibacter polytrichastri]SFT21227.1 PAS domain S-box-containing protein [Mucilaginibacter polytrichastri]